MNITPVLLIILDGFGCRNDQQDNAIASAHTPNWDRLWSNYPHTLIDASEKAVGLPDNQMGNSEVGHLNIGAGRVVYQDFTRINLAVENGEFFENPALKQAVESAKQHDGALHIFGLLSDGGVHSHQLHLQAMAEMGARMGLDKIYLHAFLDGRDTPPKSAEQYLLGMEQKFKELGVGRIASIIGRYYAMDRDKRWDRVQKAYELITEGKAEYHASSALDALHDAYARGEADEFVKGTAILGPDGKPISMKDGDSIVFMNFRSDRARQLTRTFIEPNFDAFSRSYLPRISYYCTLTEYSEDFPVPKAFPPQQVKNGFGEYISGLGLKQLRIAETEKYAHVTFFFNGGEEAIYPGEDRILVASPKVATYDLKPEMSAFEVTEKLVEAINHRTYQAIICNYANADMVGHTGNLKAAVKAIETLDTCIGQVADAMLANGGEIIITADHGNAEQMMDHQTNQAHTAHTLNLVPFLYIGRRARAASSGGALQDIAPSMLAAMGLAQPTEMTGRSLIDFT